MNVSNDDKTAEAKVAEEPGVMGIWTAAAVAEIGSARADTAASAVSEKKAETRFLHHKSNALTIKDGAIARSNAHIQVPF